MKDKNLTLTFDAVSKVAEIYINGKLDGSNIGMFSEIKINATSYFKPGKERIPTTRHYGRQWVEPRINIPVNLPDKRVNAQLVLKLYNENRLVANNAYAVTLAEKSWKN